MKTISLLSVSIGVAAFTFQPSFADCVDVTGSVNKEARSGIAKDGTQAPLESGAVTGTRTESPTGTTTTSADAGGNAPQKDGRAMPMGESPNLATSNQDVVSQQKGGETAAATATKDKCN
ncbi:MULTISPECIES: hypothetical protein [Rhizobium/Agrobacterium group]|uniref:Exopolysaccharide production protein YjbE n=2 Tax=Neorhizobium TaxID=1525371 RepID=A0ABV0M2P1_9HYPH|nr:MULTISPECIES: hypothetical protein [Rhizobium/Agrobacterium group]MCC2609586.1 hypothetical protein [Neorhizobium petrolearium]WGI69787.1 hypothetical protein QEO92_06925 [Neorhizobium petrolearium]